jgi:plasmid replication initiation protein
MSSISTNKKIMVGELMNKELRPLYLSQGVAVSDNKLINACYRMTAVQKRIFNMAVASCNSKQFLDTGEVVVSIDDFAELTAKSVKESIRICRTESRNLSKLQVVDVVYKEKREKGMMRKIMSADEREKSEDSVSRISYKNFFQEVEFIEHNNKRCLYFKFSDWLVPYVEFIRKKFSQVPLVEVSRLGSFYSLRLFDFLMATKQVGKIRKRVFTYAEFREILGFVGEKKEMYLNWSDFRKRCLITPVNELNEKTGYDFCYEISGRGDSLRKITITAKKKEQIEMDI